MGLDRGRTSVKAALIALAISLLLVTSSAQRAKVLAPHQPIAPRVPMGKELPLTGTLQFMRTLHPPFRWVRKLLLANKSG